MTKQSRPAIFKLSYWLSIGLFVSLIAGCGAGFQLANGIGGTGITMGSITGFGSMFVNGIKFDTDNATFSRDGVDAKLQSDFSTGEVVKIIGTVNADGKTGIASEVIFSDLVEGPITAFISATKFEVLGQIVIVDKLTVLHDFQELSALKLDNMLEISGFINAEGEIHASSIKLLQDSFSIGSILNVEGVVSDLDPIAKTFRLNKNLLIDYSSTLFDGLTEAQLVNGLYLVIDSEQNITNDKVIAQTLMLIDTRLETNITYQIEGLITRFVSSSDFDIDGIPVSSNAQTVYKNSSSEQLGLNTFVIIEGTSNADSVLIAESITLFDSTTEVWIEGNIEFIDSEKQQIRLLGQTISADSFTLFTDETQEEFIDLNFEQLSLGDFVSVTAYRNNQGQAIASRISKASQEFSTLYLSAKVDSLQAELGIINLFGQTVQSDSLTLYFDTDNNIISKQEFFDTLASTPDHIVDVTGVITGDKMIQAETMGLLLPFFL